MEKTNEELMQATPEEWAVYNEIASYLPSRQGKNGDYLDKFGVQIPYHAGPHILKHFKRTIEIVNPSSILEIGFNLGHSAFMWLSLSDASLVSIDTSEKDETFEGAVAISKKFGDRFWFSLRSDFRASANDFDLAYIDGGHEEEDVTKDIQLCKDLKIPYLLFDDIYPRFGPGVMLSIEKFDLELVEDMDNLRLYKFKK